MKKLQLRRTKVDWLKIINLALNKKEWGKTYTLYTYDDVSITAEIYEFNFSKNKAIFLIKCIYPNPNIYEWRDEVKIEYFLNNFTIEEFKSLLKRKVTSLLKDIITELADKKARTKYHELYYTTSDIRGDLEIIGEHGYLKDYNSTLQLSEELADLVIDEIYNNILNKLNEEFNTKISAYKEKAREIGLGIDCENLFKLKKQLEGDKK